MSVFVVFSVHPSQYSFNPDYMDATPSRSSTSSLHSYAQHDSLPLVDEFASQDNILSFNSVQRDPESWAHAAPASQGLYDNENDKDSCGVGFICHIKGEPSHKIVSDARQLLCAMTHRGAVGADSRDGDGAGVMTGIPHFFFKREAERDIGATLPEPGQYAVGNVFFKPNDPVELQRQQSIFSKLADELDLRVLGWREVPTDGSILGPAASSKEPLILQPFIVLREHYGDGNASQNGAFDSKRFERQLYILRKQATHMMYVFAILLSWLKIDPRPLAPLRNGSTSAVSRPKTSCTRANSLPRKYITTITTSIMSSIVHTSPWFTLASPQTLSRVGTVLNLCDGRLTTVSRMLEPHSNLMS